MFLQLLASQGFSLSIKSHRYTGVIVRPLPGDVLAMSPPFVISEEQIDRIVMVLDRAIGSVATELRPTGT